MDKSASKPKSNKSKTKKQSTKPKSTKKKKSDGPSCSMFLAELTKKFALKKKQEDEAPHHVVRSIIDSLTNAMPITFSKKSPPQKQSPFKIEELQAIAPELVPNDVINNTPTPPQVENVEMETVEATIPTESSSKVGFKMPRMPLVNSEVLKVAALTRRQQIPKEDISTNTGVEQDVASEISKHVNTLRKISLIAEEFNQKTARNLKEIVDSVQEDLMKKLEEIKAEQKAKEANHYEPSEE